MLINYSMSKKKMGFFISTTIIYNSLGDSPTRFTKIIVSAILFWTFTKINIKFGPMPNIKWSTKLLKNLSIFLIT